MWTPEDGATTGLYDDADIGVEVLVPSPDRTPVMTSIFSISSENGPVALMIPCSVTLDPRMPGVIVFKCQ